MTSHSESGYDDIKVCLFVQDTDLRYRWIENPPAGLPVSDFLGKTDREVFGPGEWDPDLHTVKEEVLGANAMGRHVMSCHRDGQDYDYHLEVYPVGEDGTEPGGLRGALIDITSLKNARTELRHRNTELRAFTSSISHDLRAPINTMTINAELLRESLGDQADPVTLKLLARIGEGCKIMDSMIEGLLTLSRLGRESIKRQHVDMQACAQEIARELKQREAAKTVRVEIGPMPAAWADPGLIRNVFQNLLMNAIKFSHRRELPIINIGGEAQGRTLLYWVKDNGIGFDNTQGSKLFKPFSRLHDDPMYEGTGIGLSLIERIISRHGGRVWAESAPDQGASFYFSLPTARPILFRDAEKGDSTGREPSLLNPGVKPEGPEDPTVMKAPIQ